MANERIPFRSRAESKSMFFRERLILNIANLRYELEVISILTPLPPIRTPKLAVLKAAGAPDKAKSSKTGKRWPCT
jgi:hypothetical protein